ncbi:condensation domain-containing protein [Saccharothrix deserti]|uniref:condensation domain-containing protein n=1 Tax=Saccharothrix deserti TaxID=2593674 RepID=UPI00192E4591|nr:condensation domain-containing protein [Saccharothrix deserti]
MSPTERWYWIADQLSTLNVSARVRIEGELSTVALRRALAALQARHPLLRLAITASASGTDPRFLPTDNPIPLREVILTQSEDTRWVREVDEQELAVSIDWGSGPLARAVLITQPGHIHDLVITVAHCISDGTTLLSLLRQWVRLAAEPPAADQTVASGPVRPAVEDLFPARYRGGPGGLSDKNAADEEDPGAVQGEVGRLTADRFVPFHQRRTRLLHRFLASDALENLTLACKREGATVHGVLAAAMVSAVARDAGTPSPTHFTIGSPVSFRDELDPPPSQDEVGPYVSAVHSVVQHRPDDLWSMARSITGDIAERRQRGEHFAGASLLTDHGPAGVADSEPFVRFIEEHGPFNFFISNIGRFDFPDTLGPWQLSGAQFVGGISVVGYFAASVSTSHGQLSWNFTYIDEAISPERAERLADDSVRIALEAARLD